MRGCRVSGPLIMSEAPARSMNGCLQKRDEDREDGFRHDFLSALLPWSSSMALEYPEPPAPTEMGGSRWVGREDAGRRRSQFPASVSASGAAWEVPARDRSALWQPRKTSSALMPLYSATRSGTSGPYDVVWAVPRTCAIRNRRAQRGTIAACRGERTFPRL